MAEPKEEHGPSCTGCQILGLMAERDAALAALSTFVPIGDGVYRVAGMRRSAITNKYVIDDSIPLAPTPDGQEAGA